MYYRLKWWHFGLNKIKLTSPFFFYFLNVATRKFKSICGSRSISIGQCCYKNKRVYFVVLLVGACRGSGKCSPKMPWLQLFQLTWLGLFVLQGCFEGSCLQAATTSLLSLTLAIHEVFKINLPPPLMVSNFCPASWRQVIKKIKCIATISWAPGHVSDTVPGTLHKILNPYISSARLIFKIKRFRYIVTLPWLTSK